METDNENVNDDDAADDLSPKELSFKPQQDEIPILEADTIYLLMKENIPISRVSRVDWLLRKINTYIVLPSESSNSLYEDDEFIVLSIIPTELFHDRSESNQRFKYLITTDTKLKFLANCYRMVYCLDMSPSQSAVDIQCGEILFDEILKSFKCSLEGVSRSFTVPGSRVILQPKIYLTVIAHTPFFMTPAQQVLIKGIMISSSKLEEIFALVEKRLKILEERISDVSGLAQDQIDEQAADAEKLVDGLFEEDQLDSDAILNIPMVSPDANFVNMLRYSMLALSLLPEHSLSNIILVTDGVVALPDVNIMESLLMQLHYDSSAVSFIKIGSPFHPHVCAGYVPYTDILRFISHSTMGSYLENLPEISGINSHNLNEFHKAYLLWSFNTSFDGDISNVAPDSTQWTTTNKYFYGQKVPTLLRKKQIEDKINTSLSLLLSRRIRAGFTVDKIQFENDLLQIELSLPWKNFIYLQYAMTSPWPPAQAVVYYTVHVAAPYEFLHDITCLIKKELKSTFRQAVVERFWCVLTHLASGDTSLAQHMYSFQNSNVWFSLPESVKNRMSTFTMINNTPVDITKPQFITSDMTCPKFGSIWQPICQLENSQWNKWFHTHKISLIVRHDDPIPRNLHLANSSGRFQLVQCRQSAFILNSKLSDWSSFTLIENHSYVKFLYKETEKPIWFCIIRVISKLPCVVINVGFINGTPGHIRRKVCQELKKELTHLSLPSLKSKENACTLLHKPLEKILIRYERVPSDFNTVVFPDGTQPPNPHQVLQPPPLFGALFTTLSRYLYHKRWIWNATYLNNPKLGIMAIAQILNTIIKMRIKEGFSFAHSAAGIINMVLEVKMSASNSSSQDTLPCIIQYVLFPPHSTSRSDSRELGSGSEDETDLEPETEIELQMITEVWIEPQYGYVTNSPPARSYMESEPYYKLADKIGYVDSKCINSLLTLEHLSLMCQAKSIKKEETQNGIQMNISKQKSPRHKSGRNNSHCQLPHNAGYFSKHLFTPNFSQRAYEPEATPLIDERIHQIPFHFNLNNILPICQQTELLFSMFMEDETNGLKFETGFDKPNKLLLDSVHEHLQLLHDSELSIGPEDSLQFLRLLYDKHTTSQSKHQCPLFQCFESYAEQSSSNYIPQWRCFIKGISITHVILTFAPSSLEDLKLLMPSVSTYDNQNYSQLPPQDSEDSIFDALNCAIPEDQRSVYSDQSDSIPKHDHLILPLFVYDCPLAVLINSYIDKKIQEHFLKDIYEDHTYKTTSNYDDDFMQRKRAAMVHRSPDHKSDDSDADDINSSVRQHCKTLTLVHSKCFVVSLFKSLRFKIPIHSSDVQSAVDQCEEIVDEIEITEYLRIICGHLKLSKGNEISLKAIKQTNECLDLKPVHKLIQEKFMKITKIAFQPVPSNTEFYFCSPCITPDKMTTIDEDSDDEMSSAPSEIIFKSDQESIISIEETNPGGFVNKNSSNTAADFEADEISPLFLQLMCTVRIQSMVYSVPVKVLPTCLGEIVDNINHKDNNINKSNLRITLDIICLTLPPNVQSVISESAFTGLRTTSFCSGSSPLQAVSTSSDVSLGSDDHADTMYSLNHLPEFQQITIKNFKEEIKWLLRDEIATALLDLEPVSQETLNMVIEHVETSGTKFSCKKDVINLNFVYGATHSRNKFIQEFRKLTVNMRNNVCYKLCETDDLYYLIKNSNTSENNSAADHSGSSLFTTENKSEFITNSSLNELHDFQNQFDNQIDELSSIHSTSHSDYLIKNCDVEKIRFYQGSESSITMSSIDDMKNCYDDVISDEDEDYEWLNQIDQKRLTLPNFWLILRLEQDTVTIYFHCRFLELKTSKVTTFLNVQKNIVIAIKDLCKRVNQSLLLQYLHDTRMCDRLLEPEDDKKDVWHSDSTTPTLTRNTSFARLKSVDDCLSDGVEYHQVAYLEASLKFTPGFFRCNPVWETHFLLHPRLKTGPGKSGLSRGIQALRTVLNKFSVSNRSNMFVYQDVSSNVFYLRLHENVKSCTKMVASRSKTEISNGVSRSPSIASLPLGQQKSFLNHSDYSIASMSDIRPRVRSIGEKERSESIVEDTIILKVHGITDAGPDVKCDLVQVLQNRLDDAVLEILSMMLARNAMCPLTPADVHFLQKPFRPPEHIIRLFIPEHAHDCLDAFIHYLRQNILQFLNVPKYTDPNSYNHFKDYSDPDQGNNYVKDDQIFVYNQSHNPSSGSRGIACVSLAVVTNNKIVDSMEKTSEKNTMRLSKDATFENIVATHIIEEKDSANLPKTYLEFRIWKQGRVNLDTLIVKLKSAVSQGMWDLIHEYHFLKAPLCCDEDEHLTEDFTTFSSIHSKSISSVSPTEIQFLRACRVKSTIHQRIKKIAPAMSRVARKLNSSNNATLPISISASFNSVDNSLKNSNSSLSYTDTTNTNTSRSETMFKNTENKLNLNKFEKGERGNVHDLYSNTLVKWFEYGIELNVPALKKCHVPLSYRHPVNICVRELQHIVNSIAPDTSVKAFDLQYCKYNINNRNDVEVYVPYNSSQMSMKCLLIGRNFDQWKISSVADNLFDYTSWIETSLLKHYQKFSPCVVPAENILVPRQRLFLGIIASNEMTFYMYNWSKERVDKLIIQCNNMGMWLGARASLLSSVVSQKRGLFHNQLTARRCKLSSNPYLNYICESLDHLQRFPSSTTAMSKDWGNRKPTQTNTSIQESTIDAFRDAKPFIITNRKTDKIMAYLQEMYDIKQRSKTQIDEKKKMHAVWQSRGSTKNLLQTPMLKRHARTIHYCHTPLLFLPRWRLMSAATRDHSLNVELAEDVAHFSSSEIDVRNMHDESWHDELCSSFIREYKQYLQILGFVPLETDEKKDQNIVKKHSICYVQKPMLGGIMIFTIELTEPFFTVKLHAIECCRLQQKVSRNLFNQFTLSFLDECDRIKCLMHLHSFTYDFHLRCVHSYAGNNTDVKIDVDYHLTRFLDDFNKYYPKTPNFARNVVSSEIIIIKDLLAEGQQLYTYLLSNNKQYGMHVLSMKKRDLPEETDNDYVLVQVTSIPQVMYKDSQDRQQTDDFNVTLIVTNLGIARQAHENVLRLKFYIVVTSRREIYPKSDVEKTLGKFRTVSSTEPNPSSIQDVQESLSENLTPYICDSSISEVEIENSQKTDSVRTDSIRESSSSDELDGQDLSRHKVVQPNVGYVDTHEQIKLESVNYLGYYSSHEQLMQQLMVDQASIARQQIRNMVAQGMVHCRTHLLWNKLVSHHDSNFLTFDEFLELRGLAKLENLIDFHPDLKILLDHPFSWYQSLAKLLISKYHDHHRVYVSPDNSIQHIVVLHPRYIGTFMMVSMDLHMSRGDLYAASREPPQFDSCELSSLDRKELINGFINCVAAHVWSGIVQS